jgi:hypothetical protein
MIDVHVYDRKIEYKVNVPIYTEVNKNDVITGLLANPSISQASKLMLNLILLGGNIDNVNGYDATDLLVHLIRMGKGDDLLMNLNEQLADMYNLGRCPQGRVIRLISLINAFVI